MKFKAFQYLVIILFFAACNKEKNGSCFSKAGELSNLQKEIPAAFNAIRVEDNIDVFLEYDPEKTGLVELKGPENVIKNISFLVQGDSLTIQNKNNCRWLRELDLRIEVRIKVDTLAAIHTLGSSAVFAKSLVCNNLYIHIESPIDSEIDVKKSAYLILDHREAATLTLSGYAAIFVPVLYHTGKLNAFDFIGDYTFVYHYGLNEAHIGKPYKALEANILNSGNVLYSQEPIEGIIKKGNGNGQLLKQ